MYYFHPGRFGLIQSTKGHSVLKKWAYGGSRAGAADYDDAYVERYAPTFIPRHVYDTGREEREIHRGVDREIIFSDHMMDECYDTARKSHNKDAALLREATAAVVNSETYSDPRAVVASRRAARGVTYYHEPPRYIPPPPPQQPQHQPPRTNYPSRRLEKEAALVGSKVDVVLPKRRRPRSQYAQSVMRDIKRQEISKEEVSAEATTGLKAHPRVPARKYRVVYY